jgi:hypothetical protein
MKEAEPQQGRRLDPPLLDLSLNPTVVDAVRQLDGTGANGPRRPPAGAVRLRHAERPASWPMPEDPPFGSTPQKDRPSAPNRLPMPSSAHCTATPVAAWRRVIASPLVALASKSAACRVWGGAGLAAAGPARGSRQQVCQDRARTDESIAKRIRPARPLHSVVLGRAGALGAPGILGAFAFGSHASVGDLTSHLNAGAESRVSLQAPKPRPAPKGSYAERERLRISC